MKKFYLFVLFSLVLSATSAYSQNTFSYKIGGIEVVVLADAISMGDTSILIGATPEMIENALPDGSYENSILAFLLKTPSLNILIDTGVGRNLSKNLSEVGLSESDIDVILLTHLHGDHIGGLLNGDQLVFPKAELYISTPEYEYWKNEKLLESAEEGRKEGILKVRKVLDLYDANIKQFTPTQISDKFMPLLPGVQDIAAFGHTPGHTAYMIKIGARKLLIWGDLMHAMKIQMPYPEVSVTYDVDPDMAVKTRMQILEYVSKNNIPIAGMHLPYPKIGFVKKSTEYSGGYTFVPILR